MKTNFKRLFALALTLCLLASLMVPVAFAEDVAVAASANVAEAYNIRLVDLSQIDHTTATGWNTSFKGSSGYKNTSLKSSDATLNATLIGKIDAAYADGSLDWKFLDSEGEAVYREDRMFQLRSSGWVAIQIRVSASGMYALNLATDKNDPAEGATWSNMSKEAAGDVAAYIVPVADLNQAIEDGATFSTADGANDWVYPTVGEVIPNLLTDDYSVGTATMAAEDTSVTFAKQRMEAGEYVVIYDGYSHYSISEMSLLGNAYAMENVAAYALRPFDLSNTDITTYAGTVNEQMLASGALTDRVNTSTVSNGEYGLDWSYYSAIGSSYFRASGAWQMDAKSGAVGLVINIPESGEMYLSLTTDKSTYESWSNSYTSFAGTHKAYLIPYATALEVAGGTSSSARKTALTTLTADDTYSLGERLMTADQETVTFNKTYVEAGEYLVAFYAIDGQAAYSELSLSKVAGQELPESEKLSGTVATYDFEIYNNERYAPIFTSAEGTVGNRSFSNKAFSGLEGVYEKDTPVSTIFDNDYAAGIINYNLEDRGTMPVITFRATNKTGLRIQNSNSNAYRGEEGPYAAFRLNVPATALYNVDLAGASGNYGGMKIYVFGADYEGTIADNMTEANLAATFGLNETNTSFESVLSAGDNIIVFNFNQVRVTVDETGAEKIKEDTFNVKSIVLSIPEKDAITYDFNLRTNDDYVAAVYDATLGQVNVANVATTQNLKYYSYTDAEGASARCYAYSTIANLFAAGTMNWAIDHVNNNNDGEPYAAIRHAETSLRCLVDNVDNGFAGFRIRVPVAGTYDVTVNASGVGSVYFIPATNTYDAYADRMDVTSYLTEDYLMDGNTVTLNAGEYVMVLAEDGDAGSIYLTSVVLEPVAANFVADGIPYASLEAALENAADYVFLCQNAQVSDIVVPAGVTLDLNGYVLYASSVEVASAADIIDSKDGMGLIRGDVAFNEDNAQLPLYDIDADGYKLFNVDVVSSATTGSGSSTKYWFKVSFSNAAAFDLIGMNTELRIVANMTWTKDEVDGAATATSTVDFVNQWAANSNAYIVVKTTGEASGTGSTFRLLPGVSANGVTISGDAMRKG